MFEFLKKVFKKEKEEISEQEDIVVEEVEKENNSTYPDYAIGYEDEYDECKKHGFNTKLTKKFIKKRKKLDNKRGIKK